MPSRFMLACPRLGLQRQLRPRPPARTDCCQPVRRHQRFMAHGISTDLSDWRRAGRRNIIRRSVLRKTFASYFPWRLSCVSRDHQQQSGTGFAPLVDLLQLQCAACMTCSGPYRASVARERHIYHPGSYSTSVWPLVYVADSNNLTLEREEGSLCNHNYSRVIRAISEFVLGLIESTF